MGVCLHPSHFALHPSRCRRPPQGNLQLDQLSEDPKDDGRLGARSLARGLRVMSGPHLLDAVSLSPGLDEELGAEGGAGGLHPHPLQDGETEQLEGAIDISGQRS